MGSNQFFIDFQKKSKDRYNSSFAGTYGKTVGTVKIYVKNHPELWVQIIFSLIFSKNQSFIGFYIGILGVP